MFAAPIGVQYILLQKDREQRERESDIQSLEHKKGNHCGPLSD